MPLYSPFTGLDGTWPGTAAAAQYDPNLMATLGLFQQPLYFPGAADIWGQDTTGAGAVSTNPLMMNYPSMISPVSIEQQQQQTVTNTEMAAPEITTSSVSPAAPATVLDPTGLTPIFSGLMLNGSMPGMMAVGPTNLVNVPNGPVDNMVAAPVGNVVPLQNTAPEPSKPKSWATIAGQPAKPRPPPPPKPSPQPEPQVMDSPVQRKSHMRSGQNSSQAKSLSSSAGQSSSGKGNPRKSQPNQSSGSTSLARTSSKGQQQQSELVGKLLSENKYNPSDFSMNVNNARFFVIKSYAEDDIHRSIKYSIWTSTEHGNRRLDQAFRDQKGKGNIYLLFSVNGSGHFCGVAQMMSEVDTNTSTGVWAQDKWKGRFDVKWIYVKDVPNSQLRHIRLENNENKPVTNSRDTQEVPLPKAKQVMKIFHSYQHTTSIFDDFDHYEKKQEEESGKVSFYRVLCVV